MTRNHIRIPGERSCDWRLLADLRALDRELDLHYLGDGQWALGAVRWTPDRYLQGGRLRRLKRRHTPQSARLAELAMQGFARIAIYDVQGEPTTAIVNDFRERDWRYRHEHDEAFEAALAKAAGRDRREAILAAMMGEIEAREKDSYGYFFRGRRTFDMGGMQ